jgi:hypothetical protein
MEVPGISMGQERITARTEEHPGTRMANGRAVSSLAEIVPNASALLSHGIQLDTDSERALAQNQFGKSLFTDTSGISPSLWDRFHTGEFMDILSAIS